MVAAAYLLGCISEMKRGKAIVARWFTIGLLAVGGAAAFSLLAPVVYANWHELGHYWDGYWRAPATALTIVLAARKVRAFPAIVGRLQSTWCWPPLWFAALLGSMLVCAFAAWNPAFLTHLDMPPVDPRIAESCKLLLWWLATLMSLLVVSSYSYETIKTKRKPQKVKTKTSDEMKLGGSDELLANWYLNDSVVDRPDLDLLGTHTVLAKRIAKRLQSSGTEAKADTALLGPLGSGKTTVLQLVRWFLSNERLGAQ